MDEHRARKNELLNLETFTQLLQKAARSVNGDLIIFRVGFADEVVISGQMDDGRDPLPVVHAQDGKPGFDALIRCDVDGNARASGRRRRGSLEVETDDIVELFAQPPHDRGADPPVRTGNQNDVALGLVNLGHRHLMILLQRRSAIFPISALRAWSVAIVSTPYPCGAES